MTFYEVINLCSIFHVQYEDQRSKREAKTTSSFFACPACPELVEGSLSKGSLRFALIRVRDRGSLFTFHFPLSPYLC
jgi:hypothetical protein